MGHDEEDADVGGEFGEDGEADPRIRQDQRLDYGRLDVRAQVHEVLGEWKAFTTMLNVLVVLLPRNSLSFK